MLRRFSSGLLVLLLAVTAARAGEPSIRETRVDFDVQRNSRSDQPRTLRFLRANRSFLRSELDRLQTRRVVREGEARELTAHERLLLEQSEEIATDQDSLGSAVAAAQREDYLQSASDLLAFEAHLDELEGLMQRQNTRLKALEADFVARQETALALYVTGLGPVEATSIEVSDPDGDQWRISLDPAQRAALRAGATAQLFHEFVEPRPTTYALSLQRADGETVELGDLELEPRRDRLTLVEVDLSRSHDGALSLRTWER